MPLDRKRNWANFDAKFNQKGQWHSMSHDFDTYCAYTPSTYPPEKKLSFVLIEFLRNCIIFEVGLGRYLSYRKTSPTFTLANDLVKLIILYQFLKVIFAAQVTRCPFRSSSEDT